jgi:hypothetical protein
MKRKGLRKGAPGEALVAPGEGRRGQEGQIGYLLRQAQGAFRQAGDAALAETGLTLPQYGVLSWLVVSVTDHPLRLRSVCTRSANLDCSSAIARPPTGYRPRSRQRGPAVSLH